MGISSSYGITSKYIYEDDTLFFVSPHNKFFRSLFYAFALTRLPPLPSHSKIYVRK